METCTAAFEQLARQVGGINSHDSGLIAFRSPFALSRQAVIEALLIVGAAAGLVHAIRWKRAHGDVSNLVVWWSGILCLLLMREGGRSVSGELGEHAVDAGLGRYHRSSSQRKRCARRSEVRGGRGVISITQAPPRGCREA